MEVKVTWKDGEVKVEEYAVYVKPQVPIMYHVHLGAVVQVRKTPRGVLIEARYDEESGERSVGKVE